MIFSIRLQFDRIAENKFKGNIILVLLCFFCSPAWGQDTLFFRDGSFATGKIQQAGFRKITYMQYNVSGDSVLVKEKSSRLDSIFFKSGLHYRKGVSEASLLPDENLQRFGYYWQGRYFGNKQTEFPKSLIAVNYLAGLGVIGLPYTMYKAGKLPPASEIPTPQTLLMKSNKDFARGYSDGVKRTNLNAFLPVYLSGLLTSFLAIALFYPR